MDFIIFGTGVILEQSKEQIDFSQVLCFIDNNVQKQNTILYGKTILSLEEIGSMEYSKIVIFSTKYFQTMYRQLIGYGIPKSKIMSWYFFLDLSYNMVLVQRGISSGNLLSRTLNVVQKKMWNHILEIGDRLPKYGVLNCRDVRIKEKCHDIVIDSYTTEFACEKGAAYNIYGRCCHELGETASQVYDAVFFLDPFLRMDLSECKQAIKDTFALSDYILLNIPYGDVYPEWIDDAFLSFGQIETFYYHDACLLLIKKEHASLDFCKIFVVTHKGFNPPEDKMYVPIQAGAEGKPELGFMLDSIGDNISSLNPWINECTALYWIWKHVKCEYIGLNHYRRYFLKDNSECSLDHILDQDTIKLYMQSYDILLAKAAYYYPNSSVGQAIVEHVDVDAYTKGLKIVRDLLAERQPDYLQTFDDLINGWAFYPCNMFVMRKAVMDVYCEWLFSFLIDAAQKMDIWPYDDYSKRIIGFLAERMLTVWLMHHQLKIKECPVLLLS